MDEEIEAEIEEEIEAEIGVDEVDEEEVTGTGRMEDKERKTGIDQTDESSQIDEISPKWTKRSGRLSADGPKPNSQSS